MPDHAVIQNGIDVLRDGLFAHQTDQRPLFDVLVGKEVAVDTGSQQCVHSLIAL